jgi:hypothetical protein
MQRLRAEAVFITEKPQRKYHATISRSNTSRRTSSM